MVAETRGIGVTVGDCLFGLTCRYRSVGGSLGWRDGDLPGGGVVFGGSLI